jgi:NAD(P)-dependent dehydrogenase (short-subunit alcohol dehydrogenase family)
MQESKVVLVSAGASGVGRAIAASFRAQGHRVHVCDLSAERIGQLRQQDSGITSTLADCSSAAEVDRVFDDVVGRYGALDVLVNNVGIAGPTAPVEEIRPEDWDRTLAADLSSHFYATRRAVPLLKARGGGSILNIASSAAFFGFPLRSAYAAAKWAMIGLTKTWAMELGPHGIRVNALCPGSVSGPRIDAVVERDARARGVEPGKVRDVYLRQTSMRVFVDAEDVAQAALFLCSDAGRHISGQAIGIDGHTEGLSNWLA